ncbi:MAG: nucleotidyltransferase domain-containing protein [Patescibacteria group bacterium]
MNTSDMIFKIRPVLRKYDVKKADIFGSVASGEATNKSDVDLLVEMPKNSTLLGFVRLKRDLEQKLLTSVDLVEYSSVNSKLAPFVFNKIIPVL